MTALVEVRDLEVRFALRPETLFGPPRALRAVSGVSFDIARGEALGLVGESGCGKTTVGRCLLRLQAPSAGRVSFDGRDLSRLDRRGARGFRRRVQAVFQDPYSSLNPRMRVGEIVGEPLMVHGLATGGAERAARVRHLLDMVGLPARAAQAAPHELSGGQRQRVGIARALALEPDFIVCDEAVSALDVSIQAQILRLLEDLRAELGLTYLFIGHDLAVVRHLCDRVAVMYLGRIVEIADAATLFAAPAHPYTRALIAAAPIPDPVTERARPRLGVGGEIPSPLAPPPGCAFHPRCPIAEPACARETPAHRDLGDGHAAACLKAGPAPAIHQDRESDHAETHA